MTLFVMIVFILLLLIAVPVGLSVGITSIIPGLISDDFSVSGVYILRSALGGVNSYPLLAIPMFVLSGIIMSKGGVSKKLFEIFSFFIGKRTAEHPVHIVRAGNGSIRKRYVHCRHHTGYTYCVSSYGVCVLPLQKIW